MREQPLLFRRRVDHDADEGSALPSEVAMLTALVLTVLIIVILNAQRSGTTRAPRRRSRRDEMLERALNPLDHSDPLANTLRNTLKQKHG